jgi:uncharacterized protein (DUF2252 family)
MGRISAGLLSPPHEVLTPEEWRRLGRQRRKFVPRSSQSGWQPPPDRPDPVEVIEEQAKTRDPDLVPLRHGRMAASPFAYFRGAAAPMAWDVAHLPSSDIRVQACGDAHLLNFGLFAAPDRRLVFDVNDFDETLRAPFEWDVKRLAASVAIAARDNEFEIRSVRTAVRRCAHAYRTEMENYARMKFMDVWYSRIDVDQVSQLFDAVQSGKAARRRGSDIKKAYKRTSMQAMLKLCHLRDGQYRIRAVPPVIVRLDVQRDKALFEELRSAVEKYQETLQADRREVLSRYDFGDFARKVVGVGSVGLEAFVALLHGERDDEPMFLQFKEAQESVFAPFAGPSEYQHQGERVVRGQRKMQAASDPFLGWTVGIRTNNGQADYYVRQLRDMKGAMNVAAMDPPQLTYYAGLCGWALSRAHARTGRAAMISGYLGSSEAFDCAIEEFAVEYAEQNAFDFGRLLAAIESQRLPAIVGL